MKIKNLIFASFIMYGASACNQESIEKLEFPVQYVNPYMGNVSHLLVPTFPTIHLPNSMLRVYPERADYTSDLLHGLPLIVTSHRGSSAFNLSPYQGDNLLSVIDYSYDNEVIKPYYYEVDLEDGKYGVKYAPSHQSALYEIDFSDTTKAPYLIINTQRGEVTVRNGVIEASQQLENNTRVYIYIETDVLPEESGILEHGRLNTSQTFAKGNRVTAALKFANGTGKIKLRYGVSFISTDQASKNLAREIKDFSLSKLVEKGECIWNDVLSAISVESSDETNKTKFYTSLYRVFERPVCISEDGHYYSAFDGKVHADNGVPFYTDDWIWDTYRAAHPLRVLLDQKKEEDIIDSYLLMAEQMGNMWMPTFPEITGDSRRMNSNHAVATVADGMNKGLDIDLNKAYEACRKGIMEKTLAPWSGNKSGMIDHFYDEHGYIPALKENERETDVNVHPFEKRQPVAVTLGTAYDQWCLSLIADSLGYKDDARYFEKCSYNYRNLFNKETGFFHPKDKNGDWITPFDYKFSGGQGARQYYGENNGWIYRWDVPHHIDDLIDLMGGKEQFATNLDLTFREPLGKSKFDFFAQLPDHTGNVGQFSMANEPSLHIPYLYNYANQPWKTQKRIRTLLKTWFRNDLMGVPGDEDGGGMSAFVVFSSLGFYPVTPGLPIYSIGSPLFDKVVLHLSNGKDFIIEARNVSDQNKYIQSATLNGVRMNRPWIRHADIMNGGTLIFTMDKVPNKSWGIH